MTNHKPATPLPWKVGAPTTDAVDGQRGIWSGKRGVADVYGYPQTAAYIAHAANAYPRLVAALRGEYPDQPLYGQWAQERFEEGIRATKEDFHGEMRAALLRELGEDA